MPRLVTVHDARSLLCLRGIACPPPYFSPSLPLSLSPLHPFEHATYRRQKQTSPRTHGGHDVLGRFQADVEPLSAAHYSFAMLFSLEKKDYETKKQAGYFRMNADSGGETNGEAGPAAAAVASFPQLTLEEEAELLAKYGAEGPYDDYLEWAAPSQFKSQMGDGHVFLTGAASDDDDDVGDHAAAADSCRHGNAIAPRRGREHAHRDPLRLYLHEKFPSLMFLDKTTPASLMETVTDTLDALENLSNADGRQRERAEGHASTLPLTGFTRSPAVERHAAVLRSGKEWARRASIAVQGASITSMASHLFVPDTHDAPLARRGDCSPMKAAGAPACTEDIEFHRLVESTEQLLAKATEALKACSAEACDKEADDIAHAVRKQQEREALLTEDALDVYFDRMEVLNGDEDDEEAVQLLRRAREGRARLRAALALRTVDTPASDICAGYDEVEMAPCAEDVDADAPSLFSLTPGLPYLCAFEMELPLSQPVAAQPLPGSNGAVVRAPEAHPGIRSGAQAVPEAVGPPTDFTTEEEKSVSLPQLLTRSTEVLALIADAELRDAQMQLDAAASREAHVRACRPGSPARRGMAQTTLQRDDRSALGLATLPSFVQQLDILLSPTREEQHYRGAAPTRSLQPDTQVGLDDGANAALEQQGGGSNGAAESVSLVNTSLERIRRQAALESFLVDREATEGHRMRIEDELVEREIRACADRLTWYAEQRTTLAQSAVQAAGRLCETERAAYAELLAAANKDRALAQQSQELRRLQETEKLVYTLILEWEVQREKLLQEEALSLRSLRRDAEEEEQRARIATRKRVDGEIAAAKKAMVQLRAVFEQQRVRPGPRTLQGENDAPAADTAMSLGENPLRESQWYAWRIAPLLRERAALLRWASTQQKVLESVRSLLVEAEGHYRAHAKGAAESLNSTETPASVVVLPENPPVVEEHGMSVGHAAADARVLDADAFVRLLWPSLHAVVRNPRRAPQHLAKLVLSLEDLQQVDWGQLRQLSLSAAQGARAQREPEAAVSVARVVKELDLSGNPLRQFDVVEAVRTFSSLQSLSVSHAQLHTLAASGATATTGKVHAAGSPDQRLLSAASAASSRSSHLRHVAAARNHALAAQVHLLSLSVSSNNLASLTPLGTLASSSLVRCTATENKLTTLDSLSGCVQLRELSAAHNRLTDVRAASTMPLLRELDVGNNELATLTARADGGGDEGTSSSPMLLSKLCASHNPLRALPTSQYVYPCLTQLFVNHTKLPSLGAATLGWFPMLTVLQAEGNEISDISGLQHCPRLRSLRLSHNRLASLSGLEPLRCCTRLQVLDLTGNPCLVEDSNDAQIAAAVTRALYELSPSLEVLNNRPRERARELRRMPESHSPSTHAPTTGTEVGDNRDGGWHADAALAACVTSSSRYLPATPQLYREVFAALCWDAQLQHVLEEKELREAYAQRPLNRAKGWELTASDAAAAVAVACAERDGDQPPSNHGAAAVADLNAVTAAQIHVRAAEHQRHVEHYRVDAATVSEWISLSPRPPSAALAVPAEGDPLANAHVRNFSYKQQQQDHIALLARAYLTEWLHGRVLVRRARLELARLRLAYRQSRARQEELAVQRIQPVWRGAALRSRLQRFLHPELAGKGEKIDVDDFPKVNVDDWLVDNAAALAPVEVLFHDVVESARGLAPVPFDISEMTTSPAVAANSGASPPPVSTSFTRALPNDAPPQNGVASGHAAPQRIVDEPPGGEVAVVGKLRSSGSTLAEQWGPLVAAQIRKRRQKFARSHQQHVREEFLQDPLRVKREAREDRAQQRPK
ncbi:conserved hypothetical protein [Leishmania infantum JPCM5]|uniref:Uncharacterized protein n=2 Tax=Leishmania infantum TaxID=5671 RepID=A4I5Q5_LEIIN|nr:conserved hypothetical protein [Leishmania infantum JPCM5]CAM70126.1 conserved hypothetical protein [Leishmania infantum JPCM5]|eukprot:XP_001467074.1 conserved hypothetical protein [Leishmania infantum JPCM5]